MIAPTAMSATIVVTYLFLRPAVACFAAMVTTVFASVTTLYVRRDTLFTAVTTVVATDAHASMSATRVTTMA